MRNNRRPSPKQPQAAPKDFFDMILPGVVKFLPDHYLGDSYDRNPARQALCPLRHYGFHGLPPLKGKVCPTSCPHLPVHREPP